MPSALDPGPPPARAGRFDWERAVRSSTLPPRRRHVALTLATWADADGGNIRAGIAAVAAGAGLPASTVRGHLTALRSEGWLHRARHGSLGGVVGAADVHQLTVPAAVPAAASEHWSDTASTTAGQPAQPARTSAHQPAVPDPDQCSLVSEPLLAGERTSAHQPAPTSPDQTTTKQQHAREDPPPLATPAPPARPPLAGDASSTRQRPSPLTERVAEFLEGRLDVDAVTAGLALLDADPAVRSTSGLIRWYLRDGNPDDLAARLARPPARAPSAPPRAALPPPRPRPTAPRCPACSDQPPGSWGPPCGDCAKLAAAQRALLSDDTKRLARSRRACTDCDAYGWLPPSSGLTGQDLRCEHPGVPDWVWAGADPPATFATPTPDGAIAYDGAVVVRGEVVPTQQPQPPVGEPGGRHRADPATYAPLPPPPRPPGWRPSPYPRTRERTLTR